MAESDEEYHRRGGRDKFTRERNDYGDRNRREYDHDRRGNYGQRNDYGANVNKRPAVRRDENSNAAKRSRIDASDTFDPVMKTNTEEESQPVLLTFKKFLVTQDDTITDEEAITKYSEYKMDFKRQELLKFFQAHKDEEWFRLKYHPENSARRKAEQKDNVSRRFKIFNELFDEGRIDKLRIDFDQAANIIRTMDTLVVKLEGGTDEDVVALQHEKIDDESVLQLKSDSEAKENNGTNGEEKDDKTTVSNTEENKDSSEDNTKMKDPQEPENKQENCQKKKMLLHKTSSIFLRNVAPTITLEEIESVCKRFPGFLRVGLAEPLPDRKFFRRGWVTFRRDVNIKEICWNLNSVRIKDCDLGAIINRDLARRVRSVNGVTAHKQVAQNDLRQAAKLAALCDKKWELYQPESGSAKPSGFELDLIAQSQNPLLKNLTDFLIEEASAEEEELLGITNEISSEDQKVAFQRDDELLAKLDKIIIYLRIVHSIDFYNHGEYPNEDIMPNRCGMMHVRAAPPSSSQWGTDESGQTLVAQKFITDFISAFNSRIESNLIAETEISMSELQNLGRKDPEKEVEAFITANSIELAKDKWLCPLSGKKFKGPEFIRKHLSTKHVEKLDEVRQEALYYNNYLADSKRPQNQEVKPLPPPSAQQTPSAPVKEERRERDYEPERVRQNPVMYSDRERRPYGGGGPNMRYGGGSSYGNRYDRSSGPPRYWEQNMNPGPRRDPREPITYKDLDAPEDIF